MNKQERQEEYVRRHAAQIVSFAKIGYRRDGRGVVLIGWPSQDPEQMTDEIVYLPEERVKLELKQMQTWREITLADRIIESVEQYDPSWEVAIIFLDSEEKTADFHLAGFLPHRSFENLSMYSSTTGTNH